MRLDRLKKYARAPWAIEPGALAGLMESANGALPAMPQVEREEDGSEVVDGVAVISISGVIDHDASELDVAFGSADVATIREHIALALADSSVSAIVLDFDSPGGRITGVPELAAYISKASAQKPIVSFTDSMMASAAYWLASGSAAIVSTPSADVGSIGVYIPVLDVSGYYERMGVSVDLIKAGDLKAAGYPGTTLSDDQRADLQQGVDEVFAMFKTSVSASRQVNPAAMRGQSLMGAKAKEYGLIDELGDIEDAVELAKTLGSMSTSRA